MSQLTEISIVTKKLAIGLGLTLVAFFILRFLYEAGVAYWKAAHPAPFVFVNETAFGKLPTPKFTHVATSSSGLKFKLENVGGLPIKDATPAGKVYSMPKKLPSLLADQKARDFAKKIGFTGPEEPITSTYFRFTDPDEKFRTFEIDINNMNYKLRYDYQNDPSVFTGETIASKDQVLKEVKEFILFNSLFDGSIMDGKITTTNLFYDPQTKTASIAASLSETNMMRINFFRNDLDKRKVVPPGFSDSYNYILYTPASLPKNKILRLIYTFWPISTDDFGTYPLRTSETAWQDLIDGYALVVNLGNNDANQTIVIRNIYLAYFDSEEPQDYLQPIYVFEGDNDFVAYLPAISSDWLE